MYPSFYTSFIGKSSKKDKHTTIIINQKQYHHQNVFLPNPFLSLDAGLDLEDESQETL